MGNPECQGYLLLGLWAEQVSASQPQSKQVQASLGNWAKRGNPEFQGYLLLGPLSWASLGRPGRVDQNGQSPTPRLSAAGSVGSASLGKPEQVSASLGKQVGQNEQSRMSRLSVAGPLGSASLSKSRQVCKNGQS